MQLYNCSTDVANMTKRDIRNKVRSSKSSRYLLFTNRLYQSPRDIRTRYGLKTCGVLFYFDLLLVEGYLKKINITMQHVKMYLPLVMTLGILLWSSFWCI